MFKSYLNRQNAEHYPIGDPLNGGDPRISHNRKLYDPVTAGIGMAAGSIGSSLIGASASKSAANTQAQASEDALAQQYAAAQQSIEAQKQVLQDQLRTADQTQRDQISLQLEYLGNQQRVAQETYNRQVEAANRAFEEQKAAYAPYREAGIAGQNQLLNYLGIGSDKGSAGYGKYATAEFTPEAFLANQDPGYAFRMREGLKAIDRQAAARGGLISGNALKAAETYGQDMASQEYQNAFNRYQTSRTNTLAPYQSLQNVGFGAAQGIGNAAGALGQNLIGAAGGYGSSAGQSYGAAGNNLTNIFGAAGNQRYNAYGNYGGQYTGALTGYGNAAANALTNIGQAQAAGSMGAANAIGGGISNLTNQYYQNQMLNLLKDKYSGKSDSAWSTADAANLMFNDTMPLGYKG